MSNIDEDNKNSIDERILRTCVLKVDTALHTNVEDTTETLPIEIYHSFSDQTNSFTPVTDTATMTVDYCEERDENYSSRDFNVQRPHLKIPERDKEEEAFEREEGIILTPNSGGAVEGFENHHSHSNISTNSGKQDANERVTPESEPFFETIVKTWSPENSRDRRSEERKQKIEYFGNRSVCGGDYICNSLNERITLAFVFEGSGDLEGKRFGLTCFHLLSDETYWEARKCQPIYILNSNINFPTNLNNNSSKKIIGHVVDGSQKMDTLIIEFLPEINVEVNQIRVGPNKKLDIDLSKTINATLGVNVGVELLAFGAQSRGTIGRVNRQGPIRINRLSGTEILHKQSYGIWSEKEDGKVGSRMITHDGDCGMIYITDEGIPVAMHNGISLDDTGERFVSWVIPFDLIIKNHPRYFGRYHQLPSDHTIPSNAYRWQLQSPKKLSLPFKKGRSFSFKDQDDSKKVLVEYDTDVIHDTNDCQSESNFDTGALKPVLGVARFEDYTWEVYQDGKKIGNLIN